MLHGPRPTKATIALLPSSYYSNNRASVSDYSANFRASAFRSRSRFCSFQSGPGRSAFRRPPISGQIIAEPSRSLLSARANPLLIHAIRSVRPPGAGDGGGTRPTGSRHRGDHGAHQPGQGAAPVRQAWRGAGPQGQAPSPSAALGPSDPLRWPFAQRTSSPEQASAVWLVSRNRSVGGRGFWRRRHPNRRLALAVTSAFCRDIALCADIAA